MKTIREYKRSARGSLRGNWAAAVLATLVLACLTYLFVGPYLLPMYFHFDIPLLIGIEGGALLFALFLSYPMSAGFCFACLQLYERNDDRMTGNMFRSVFQKYWHVVGGMFLMLLKLWLWSFLLIIPAFIMGFAYAMTPFILMEHPEISAWEASRVSQKMMRGHKGRLFVLCLSFFGWYLLCFFTFGIAALWVIPYQETAFAAFYNDLKAQQGEAAITG